MLLAEAKLIKWASGIFGVLCLIAVIYFAGKHHGEDKIQKAWDEDKQALQAEIFQTKLENLQKQLTAQIETGKISDALVQAKNDHAVALAALSESYNQRLHQSEARAGIYQRLSEAGPTERADLAGHAAELDLSLEQGRQLVSELRLALVQRESEIKLLGEQILSDRKVVGEFGINDPENNKGRGQ